MSVSFIIPTLNEVSNVVSIFRTVDATFTDVIEWEIIFVDDKSTDGTVEEICNLKDHRVHLIKSQNRLGLGNALNQGWEAANLNYVCFLDCDSKVPSSQLKELIEKCHETKLVIGSRFLPTSEVHGVPIIKVLGSRISTL